MTALHYSGHMISPPGADGRFPASSEGVVTLAIRAAIADVAPRTGFGSLAGGADTIIVEELLAAGAQAHVILPFPPARFIETSVQRCGPAWIGRFQAALDRVTSVTVLPSDAARDDDGFYALTTRRAMEAALEAAAKTGTPAVQLAVWDGKTGQAPAGTWHDIKVWRDGGGRSIWLNSVSGAATRLPGHDPAPGTPDPQSR